jgi:uncharacterized protein YecT (DUF1311 family)
VRTLLTLTIFLLASFAWPANASSVNSAELERCLEEAINEGALINVHRMECLKAELKKQDGQLNAIYRTRMSQVKPDEKKSLQEAQRQWIVYRDAWCRYEKSLVDMPPNIYVNELFCLVELTFQQVQRLKQTAP